MPANYDVITFDCYGTLIDWERGIRDAFADAAQRAGAALDIAQALAAYHAIEPVVQAAAYRPYRGVLAEAARQVAAQLGWPIEETTFLAESLPHWPPFPDTNSALERLAGAGYRLGILSNVDDDLLSATLRHLSAPIDLIVTAEQVRSYKPAHGHFLAARERIGGLRWLHAAQSHMHDIVPAAELGIPAAWINRKRESLPKGSAAPLVELPDLAALADWLEAP